MTITKVPLAQLCEVRSGGTPLRSKPEFYGGAIPWAKIGDLERANGHLGETEESITEAALSAINGRMFEAGTLLFAIYGSIGKMAFAARPLATNQAILGIAIRERDRVDHRYLYHWLLFNKDRFLSDGRGIAQKNLSAAYLRNLCVPLPTLGKQRRIAAVLDKADSLCRTRKRTLELLDGLTQSIFLEMFGDPVTNTKALKSRSLGDLDVDMSYGPRFYNEKYSDDGIRIVRITDLSDTGHLKFEDMPQLTLPAEEIDRHRSLPGDILFARTGATVGKVALISEDDPPNIPGAYFIRLRFPNFIHPAFAASALRSRSIQRIVFEGSRQSAQQNFSGPRLRRLPFLVPNSEDQRRFAERVSAVRSKIKHVGKHGEALDSLFASLQSRAFSGQL